MKKIALLSAVSLLLMIGARAQADVLDVLNPNFDLDTVSGSTPVVPTTITDWSSPLTGSFANTGLAPASYAGGSQAAALASYIPTSFGGFPATIYQGGIADVSATDNFYTFTIDLAQGSTHRYTTPGSFTLKLSDSSGIIASSTFLTTSLTGVNNFKPFSVTGYDGSASDTFTISISASGSGELLANNASLTGSAVPEPSNWGWIPFVGALSFLAVRRFRQGARA